MNGGRSNNSQIQYSAQDAKYYENLEKRNRYRVKKLPAGCCGCCNVFCCCNACDQEKTCGRVCNPCGCYDRERNILVQRGSISNIKRRNCC